MNINSFYEIEDDQTEEIKIEKKEMFIAVDGKAFETEEAALEYSKRIIKKDQKDQEAYMKKKAENEYKENRFRNELEDINDISKLIMEIFKEEYDVDFDNIFLTKHVRFNKNKMRWEGVLTCDYKSYRTRMKVGSFFSVDDFISSKCRGIQFGCGTGGSFHSDTMCFGFKMDVSDFPKLMEKYYELLKELEKIEYNNKIKKEYENNFNQELLSDIRYKTRVAEIRHYETMLNDAKQRLDRVVSEIKTEYEAQHPVELEPLSENYTQLKSMFGENVE